MDLVCSSAQLSAEHDFFASPHQNVEGSTVFLCETDSIGREVLHLPMSINYSVCEDHQTNTADHMRTTKGSSVHGLNPFRSVDKAYSNHESKVSKFDRPVWCRGYSSPEI